MSERVIHHHSWNGVWDWDLDKKITLGPGWPPGRTRSFGGHDYHTYTCTGTSYYRFNKTDGLDIYCLSIFPWHEVINQHGRSMRSRHLQPGSRDDVPLYRYLGSQPHSVF